MRIFITLLLILLLQFETVLANQQKNQSSFNHADPPSYYDDFNHEPNAFLVNMVRGMKPGKALDVAMGTGRNAIYLATLGWDVTGFDNSEMDVNMAVENARVSGTKINTIVQDAAVFDYGKNKWDLVVLSYVPFDRIMVDRVYESLKPGGIVMVEFFHRDSQKMRILPDDPTFADNELLQIFSKYRILHYEDVLAKQDWGLAEGSKNRLVRLWAQKKDHLAPVECSLHDRPHQEGEEACSYSRKYVCSRTGWIYKGGNCN
ncbi:MAG: type 11 [Geobacteraceae bacterium]|nr:MAG: type 11 [Geobacteraceae bacterium]